MVPLAVIAAAAALAVPSLKAVSEQPLVVRGAGFRAGEAVVVRVYGKTVTAARVRASATGAFRVRLVRPVPSLPCARLLVRATGAAGDKALVIVGPPECNQPGSG